MLSARSGREAAHTQMKGEAMAKTMMYKKPPRKETNTDILSPEQAGEMMGYSTRSIYSKLATGEIPGRKIGNRWFIVREALMSYLSGNPAA